MYSSRASKFGIKNLRGDSVSMMNSGFLGASMQPPLGMTSFKKSDGPKQRLAPNLLVKKNNPNMRSTSIGKVPINKL